MATDIRLRTDLKNNRKVKKLIRALGGDGFKSLIYFWLSVRENYPDGVIKNTDLSDIEIDSDWTGEENLFSKTLLSLDFLHEKDGYFIVNDWKEHQPWSLDSKSRSNSSRFSNYKKTNKLIHSKLTKIGIKAITATAYNELKSGELNFLNVNATLVSVNESLTNFHESVTNREAVVNVSLSPSPPPSPSPSLKDKSLTDIKASALAVYENYVSIGRTQSGHKKTQALKNITSMLKKGKTEEELILYAENYRKNEPKDGYVYACSNFYGQAKYWEEYLTKPEKKEEKKKYRYGDVNYTGEIDPYDYGDNSEIEEYLKGLEDAERE